MPWTRKQVKFLLSKGSPLTPDQKQKMLGELHGNPAMGHARKGSRALSRAAAAHAGNAKARATQMVKKGKLSPEAAARIRAKANRILGQ